MGRRILAIAAAAVIALVGAVLVLLYARGADQRAVAAASPTTVYVTNEVGVPAGTTMKDAVRLGQLVQTEVAAEAKPAGALEAVDDTNGALVALTDIPPGQYVLAASFGETPLGEKALQVGSGKLAVSVQLNDPARVGTFVTPGSFLTIFMTYKMKMLEDTKEAEVFNDQDVKGTSILLDNVKVIAMGEASLTPPQDENQDNEENAQQSNQQPSFLVTLEVSPEQATRLVHGINNYTLYAGLRGSELKVDPKLNVNDLTMLEGSVR